MRVFVFVIFLGLAECLGAGCTSTQPAPSVVINPVPATCLQYVVPVLLQGWRIYADCASGTNVPGCIQDIGNLSVTLALQYPECKDVIVIINTQMQTPAKGT